MALHTKMSGAFIEIGRDYHNSVRINIRNQYFLAQDLEELLVVLLNYWGNLKDHENKK